MLIKWCLRRGLLVSGVVGFGPALRFLGLLVLIPGFPLIEFRLRHSHKFLGQFVERCKAL